MNYPPIFSDTATELKLLNNGYVVMPVLQDDEVSELLNFYHSIGKPESKTGFHSTHFYKDRDYKKKIHYRIKSTFAGWVAEYLKDMEILFCNFMVKESGCQSVMPLHTDWTFVDEKYYRSVGIWCPLTDTSAGNGALGVIPRSHSLPFNLRGPRIPTPFHDFNEAIITHSGKLLELKAGEAVIYDHRLMHYSPANLSGHTRVAVNIIVVPKNVPLVHYSIHDDPSVIHKYRVHSEEFYLNYDAFERPDNIGEHEKLQNPFFEFTEKDLSAFLPNRRKTYPSSVRKLVSGIRNFLWSVKHRLINKRFFL